MLFQHLLLTAVYNFPFHLSAEITALHLWIFSTLQTPASAMGCKPSTHQLHSPLTLICVESYDEMQNDEPRGSMNFAPAMRESWTG